MTHHSSVCGIDRDVRALAVLLEATEQTWLLDRHSVQILDAKEFDSQRIVDSLGGQVPHFGRLL